MKRSLILWVVFFLACPAFACPPAMVFDTDRAFEDVPYVVIVHREENRILVDHVLKSPEPLGPELSLRQNPPEVCGDNNYDLKPDIGYVLFLNRQGDGFVRAGSVTDMYPVVAFHENHDMLIFIKDPLNPEALTDPIIEMIIQAFPMP